MAKIEVLNTTFVGSPSTVWTL